jgi:selenide,water dikinase
MAVTGLVDPKRVLTNAGARPGDLLILTKPIGSGIATTANKRGEADAELSERVTQVMATLNKVGGEVFSSGKFKVNALTDVTGFGLLGHLLEMMNGAKARAKLYLERIPIIQGVPDLAARGVVPGGSKGNLEFVGSKVRFPDGLPDEIRLVLADAQTNGGLLAAVPVKDAGKAVRALERKGVDGAVIGEVVRGKAGIEVVG